MNWKYIIAYEDTEGIVRYEWASTMEHAEWVYNNMKRIGKTVKIFQLTLIKE